MHNRLALYNWDTFLGIVYTAEVECSVLTATAINKSIPNYGEREDGGVIMSNLQHTPWYRLHHSQNWLN